MSAKRGRPRKHPLPDDQTENSQTSEESSETDDEELEEIGAPERISSPKEEKNPESDEEPTFKEIPLPKENKKLKGKKILDFSSVLWETADDYDEIKAGFGEVTGLEGNYLDTATKAAAPVLFRLSRMVPGTGSDSGLVANIIVAVVVVGGCYAAQNFSKWFDPEEKKKRVEEAKKRTQGEG